MKHELNIWVVGGDLRQAKLAQLLAEDGHTVHTYALGEPQEPTPGLTAEVSPRYIDKADCVVLPLAVSNGEGLLNAPLALSEHPLAPILDRLSPRQFLCGGLVGGEAEELARKRGLTIHDYFAREELAVANAVPTGPSSWRWSICPLPSTARRCWWWALDGWGGSPPSASRPWGPG